MIPAQQTAAAARPDRRGQETKGRGGGGGVVGGRGARMRASACDGCGFRRGRGSPRGVQSTVCIAGGCPPRGVCVSVSPPIPCPLSRLSVCSPITTTTHPTAVPSSHPCVRCLPPCRPRLSLALLLPRHAPALSTASISALLPVCPASFTAPIPSYNTEINMSI